MMQENIRSIIASKNRYKELAPFFTYLSDKRIPYAVVKGEPLSITAYGRIGKRQSSDVDLLVSLKDAATIKSTLLTYGFNVQNKNRFYQVMALSSSHQSIPYFKVSNGTKIEVDINHELFWGEYHGERINIEEFLSDTVNLNIYGCDIHTLSPIKMLVHLVLHNYKDMNSIFLLATGKSINYRAFKDVYTLLTSNLDSITIENLYNLSNEYKIIPFLYYILYFIGILFDDNVIDNYISAFYTEKGESLLNCYGLNDSERRKWKVDFQTRFESDHLYELIKDDLTADDLEKITLNKKVFWGEQHE